MLANKAHTRLYVSNINTGSAMATPGIDVSAMTVGQVAVIAAGGPTYASGIVLADKAAVAIAGKVRIAVKETVADAPRLSDVIDFTKITNAIAVAAVNPLEKVAYIGYNSVNGAMDTPTTIEDYIVRIVLQSKLKATGDYPLWKEGVYRSKSTDGQFELATGLTKSLVANFARESAFEKFIRFERVCDGTFNDAPVATCTLTRDSAVVIKTSHGLTAGQLVRIIGATTAYPVYKVASVNTNDFTLDIPYQGVSGSYTVTAEAAATATNWGIKMVGEPRKFWEGEFTYQKADWNVQLDSAFVTATYAVTQEFNEGRGTLEEVSTLENELQQNEMMAIRNTIPPIRFRKNVTGLDAAGAVITGLQVASGYTGIPQYLNASNVPTTCIGAYDYCYINWYDDSTSSIVIADPKSYKQAIVASGVTATTNTALLAMFV